MESLSHQGIMSSVPLVVSKPAQYVEPFSEHDASRSMCVSPIVLPDDSIHWLLA